MPQPGKSRIVELSDGWSFVSRSQRGRRSRRASRPQPGTTLNSEPPVDQDNVIRIVDAVNSSVQAFENSECAKRLSSNLLLHDDPIVIKRATCLGLGSLCPDSAANAKRSTVQFAAFIWLTRQYASTSGDNVVSLHAIDPAFAPADQAVLERFRVTTVSDAASLNVDTGSQDSLFYAPYLPWPVLTLDFLAAHADRPDVLICQDLLKMKENLEMQLITMKGSDSTMEVDGRECDQDDTRRAIETCDEIVSGYKPILFPVYDLLPAAFQDLVVYSRRGDDSEV